jgi:hypothetical protein
MAITIVNSKQGAGTSLTITSATAGNILVAFISQTVSVVAPTITGWTVNGTSCTFGTANVDAGFLATKTAAGGETSIAPTAGTGGTLQGIAYYELAGASLTFDGGSSFPVATSQTASVNSLASTPFSTTNPGSVILCAVCVSNGSGVVSAWTSTVLTNITTTGTGVIGGSLIPGTTETSITPTANWTTSRFAGMLAIALTPPASGNTQGLLVAF